MVEELRKDVDHLKQIKEFKEYRHKCPNSYLCAGFMMLENAKGGNWQIDYYCPDSDKITTFSLGSKLDMKEGKTFHKDKKKIDELNLENIDVGMKKALEIVSGLRDKNYPGEIATKIIIILQNLEKKEIWNITYLTSSFKLLNVNVDAQNGNVIKEKLESVLSFTAK